MPEFNGYLKFPGNGQKPVLWKEGDTKVQEVKNSQVDASFRQEFDALKNAKRSEQIPITFTSSGTPQAIQRRRPVVSQAAEPETVARSAGNPSPEMGTAIPEPAVAQPMTGFNNTFNFVRALPRNLARESSVPAGLGDGIPFGHHALHEALFTGTIRIKATVKTPLLIVDAETQRSDSSVDQIRGHFEFQMRKDSNGNLLVCPTSVKGPLSAEYEAITNSRLREFSGHDAPLAYRMQATEGLSMVPARIEANGVRLLLGTTTFDERRRRWEVPGRQMYAAWLRMYGEHRNAWGRLAQHGTFVWAYITKWNHSGPDFRFWNVEELQDGHLPEPTNIPTNFRKDWRRGEIAPNHLGHWVQGYVSITNQNIDRKHDERVFFFSESKQITVNDTQWKELSRNWTALIQSYQDCHDEEAVWHRPGNKRDAAPEDYLGREPGQTAWSRQVYLDGKLRRDNRQEQPDARELTEGTLCYAQVTGTGQNLRITGLFPVMISRQLFPMSPESLLDQSLRPAMKLEDLSPADRVFGWCRDNKSDKLKENSGKPGAYKGQLRIGKIECSEDAIERLQQRVSLGILSTPKPSQACFYTTKAPWKGFADKNSGYKSGDKLRGRKVYPHQKFTDDFPSYWSSQRSGEINQEFRLPSDSRNSNQNRSITEWVRVGTELTFTIHITNLSKVELGALLWMLSLDQHYEGHKHFHKMGAAKPFGFGSVSMAIESTDLRSGDDWARYYLSLDANADEACQPEQATLRTGAIEAYKHAVKAAWGGNVATFEKVSFIEEFLAAARGVDGPVHYPRVSPSPDPRGENFKWFGQVPQALPFLSTSETARLRYQNQ